MRCPHPDLRPGPGTPAALAFALLLSFTAACGGGGGGGGSAAPAAPPPIVRVAALSGAEEAVPNASPATGAASFTVDPSTRLLTGTVTTSGMPGVAAHLHEGARGVAGPVVITLSGGSGGVWTVPANTVLTEVQYAALLAGGYYVNVHSAAFNAGEIRGQIDLRASFATLSGSQEVPATASTATGLASLAVNPLTGAVQGRLVTSGITGTGAHIHEGAAGTNGPVLIPLTDAGSGVWTVPAGTTLTSTQVTAWLNGGLYVNVHTAANPGGEIRGQLSLASPVVQSATLSGAAEVPATPSTATGSGAVGINPATLELSGGVGTSGLTGTGAHIHEAAAGVSGPIILPLADGGGGTWTIPLGNRFTSGQFTSWGVRNLYVNVHTAAYPSGEIRGQLGGTSPGGGGTGGGGY